MSGTARVVVIGGGAIGVAAAYYLAQRGCAVTLLEQQELASGCSRGNAGQVTPGHLPLPQPGTMWRNLRWLFKPTSPLYIPPRLDISLVRWLWQFQRACNADHLQLATGVLCRLGEASRALFDQLAQQLDFCYALPGRLEVCRTAPTFQAACAEAELLSQFGFDYERLDGKQLHEREPAIEGEVAGAIYYPDSGFCDPHQFVCRLGEAAEQRGAEIRCHVPVTGFRTRQNRVEAAVTDDEVIEGDAFVLACGSWTPQLARQVGLPLPVQPGKGYHLDIDPPDPCPQGPVVLVEERIFVTPLGSTLRLAGTMEFSGFNLIERETRLQMLATGAARYMPSAQRRAVQSRWCHLRPMTPDGLPIIGPAPRLSNLWIATGHGMLGITQGPITGKLVAEWITEGRPSMDLTAVRADRF